MMRCNLEIWTLFIFIISCINAQDININNQDNRPVDLNNPVGSSTPRYDASNDNNPFNPTFNEQLGPNNPYNPITNNIPFSPNPNDPNNINQPYDPYGKTDQYGNTGGIPPWQQNGFGFDVRNHYEIREA